MRLDHIAFRTSNRHKTVKFFMDAFGYTVQDEFDIHFDDGETARCFALEPPEKISREMPWSVYQNDCEYHLAPELFVSDGTPDSIVGQWVAARGGIGGIHHCAYQVDDVKAKMNEWRSMGYGEFTTDSPLTCENLIQVFSKPSELTGVVFEFITRGEHGFCAGNVKDLMTSTRNSDIVRSDHADARVTEL